MKQRLFVDARRPPRFNPKPRSKTPWQVHTAGCRSAVPVGTINGTIDCDGVPFPRRACGSMCVFHMRVEAVGTGFIVETHKPLMWPMSKCDATAWSERRFRAKQRAVHTQGTIQTASASVVRGNRCREERWRRMQLLKKGRDLPIGRPPSPMICTCASRHGPCRVTVPVASARRPRHAV